MRECGIDSSGSDGILISPEGLFFLASLLNALNVLESVFDDKCLWVE